MCDQCYKINCLTLLLLSPGGDESISVLPDILQTTFSVHSSANSSEPAIAAAINPLALELDI